MAGWTPFKTILLSTSRGLRPVHSPGASGSGHPQRELDRLVAALGAAYTVTSSTVFRGAWVLFSFRLTYFWRPLQSGIDFFNNLMINTVNGEERPQYIFDKSLPNKLESPPRPQYIISRFCRRKRQAVSPRRQNL